MSLARLAGSLFQTGTRFGPRLVATANPLLQRGAQLMGNPWARSILGGTIGAATNQDGTLGGRIRGGILGGGLGAIPITGTPGLGWVQSAGANQLIKAGLNPNVAQNLNHIMTGSSEYYLTIVCPRMNRVTIIFLIPHKQS